LGGSTDPVLDVLYLMTEQDTGNDDIFQGIYAFFDHCYPVPPPTCRIIIRCQLFAKYVMCDKQYAPFPDLDFFHRERDAEDTGYR
jgi:hypothetical protein